jgi:hypothetical protein
MVSATMLPPELFFAMLAVDRRLTMPYHADLVVYNSSGQMPLIVETKNRMAASRSWAIDVRQHLTLPQNQFFLLALPDRLYLWKNTSNITDLTEPNYEIDATPFFQPYYQQSGIAPAHLNGQGFELIVSAWLNELLWVGLPNDLPEPQRLFFQDSGLLEALKGGTVAIEVPL